MQTTISLRLAVAFVFSSTAVGALSANADERFPAQRREGGEQRREGGERAANSLNNFRPQTRREAALMQMIGQLQQELAQLRKEVQQIRARNGGREASAATGRENVAPFSQNRAVELPSRPQRWESTKEGKVFKAYDHNSDLQVTLDEWLKMKRVQATDITRRQLETSRFYEADPNKDGKMTVEEFLYWYSKGRFQNTTEGRSTGRRDGEASPRDTRDRE